MKFLISVHSDDGTQIDYSVDLLSAANAVSFINGWQAQQEAAQQSVQRTAEADEPDMVIPWRCRECDTINAHDVAICKACEHSRRR